MSCSPSQKTRVTCHARESVIIKFGHRPGLSGGTTVLSFDITPKQTGSAPLKGANGLGQRLGNAWRTCWSAESSRPWIIIRSRRAGPGPVNGEIKCVGLGQYQQRHARGVRSTVTPPSLAFQQGHRARSDPGPGLANTMYPGCEHHTHRSENRSFLRPGLSR